MLYSVGQHSDKSMPGSREVDIDPPRDGKRVKEFTDIFHNSDKMFDAFDDSGLLPFSRACGWPLTDSFV